MTDIQSDSVLSDNKETDAMSAKNLLKKFYLLQQERVETYGLFEEGFQAYLKGAPSYNFPMYRQLVHEITQTFSKISQDILQIIERLEKDHSLVAVVSILSGIQTDEKEKLELTVKLQLARKNALDNPQDKSYSTEEAELKESMKQIISAINEKMEELKFESEDLYTEDDEDVTDR